MYIFIIENTEARCYSVKVFSFLEELSNLKMQERATHAEQQPVKAN